MSRHERFRRVAVNPQQAQQLQTITLPAPTRGIIQSEPETFMQPGGALVLDNWMPTLRSIRIRGGTKRYCDLHALDATVPPIPDPSRKPVLSAFEYASGTNNRKMFAAQQTKVFDVTAPTPVLVASGMNNGNYTAAQLENASADWLIAVNDAGDYPLRFNGTIWCKLDPALGAPADGASLITGPAGTPVVNGHGLTAVWKYRNRLFFIQGGSMNAWCLHNIDAVGGTLDQIPLAGAFSRGGALLFGATWSVDAGDGMSNKCCFFTDQGEVAVFIGTNPADPNNWTQQGRYYLAPPMGKNAHVNIGGDLYVATVDGIIPLSQATQKDSGALELAMITHTIRPMWRTEVAARRTLPWSMKLWDELGGLFVTLPGGNPGDRRALGANNATTAWCRMVGWDALCFIRMRADMFYGTQDGTIVQCERTGTDDGMPYVATMVGGWEMFQAPSSQVIWHQARAVFSSGAGEPFEPQLDATVDYQIVVPLPPNPGPDPGVLEVWDQGLWDVMRWDQPAPDRAPIRNTLWVSIGKTGMAHAPIVQVQIAQTAAPVVELLALSVTYERAGVNV